MMGFFGRLWGLILARQRKKKVLNDCGCVCYCPACRDILNDQAECRHELHMQRKLVRYVCSCGHISHWDFDHPVPLLVKE